MIRIQRRQNILIGILFFSPLVLQLARLVASTSTLFILESIVSLILLLGLFFNDIVDLDQWFLEKAISWLSVSLEIINILRILKWLPFGTSAVMFELAIACYACSLYFIDRHFNIKNVLVIILNLNVLANYMPPAGDILILAISVLGLIFYLERVLITHTEQLNLAILIIYLITILISLIWFTPQLPVFDIDSYAWKFEAIGFIVAMPMAYFLLSNREELKLNAHVVFSSLSYILIAELVVIVAEPKIFNISLLVIFFLIYLSILNFFGNIQLSNNSKKISIFMPVFNNASTIVEALESVKKQTYRDWEIIIVDTGSTDDTEKIVTRYLRYNELPVKYFKQAGKNVLSAINCCLKYATGAIYYILNPENAVFDSNVFYRVTSALYGEKCDGIFIGLQEIDGQSRPKKIKRPKSYYPSKMAIAKVALQLGQNPYLNCIYWRKEIFETSVRKNFLTQELPAWYDAKINNGLKIANTNFIGMKYRIGASKNDKNIQTLADRLRLLHHILGHLTIPLFKYQSYAYQSINRIYLTSIWPVLFWQGKTSLKDITSNVINPQTTNPYLKTIVKFSKNYNMDKKAEITLPAKIKIFNGTEVNLYDQYLRENRLNEFYWQLMEVIGMGTGTMIVSKKDKNKLENILEFFTIKDYVKIEVK
ncbi:MAG: glycosyltransferase family 2 protein [Lactobacillus sp.]|nr:glycosyltransferase family 2 protein [Lactobacillus sp.]